LFYQPPSPQNDPNTIVLFTTGQGQPAPVPAGATKSVSPAVVQLLCSYTNLQLNSSKPIKVELDLAKGSALLPQGEKISVQTRLYSSPIQNWPLKANWKIGGNPIKNFNVSRGQNSSQVDYVPQNALNNTNRVNSFAWGPVGINSLPTVQATITEVPKTAPEGSQVLVGKVWSGMFFPDAPGKIATATGNTTSQTMASDWPLVNGRNGINVYLTQQAIQWAQFGVQRNVPVRGSQAVGAEFGAYDGNNQSTQGMTFKIDTTPQIWNEDSSIWNFYWCQLLIHTTYTANGDTFVDTDALARKNKNNKGNLWCLDNWFPYKVTLPGTLEGSTMAVDSPAVFGSVSASFNITATMWLMCQPANIPQNLTVPTPVESVEWSAKATIEMKQGKLANLALVVADSSPGQFDLTQQFPVWTAKADNQWPQFTLTQIVKRPR